MIVYFSFLHVEHQMLCIKLQLSKGLSKSSYFLSRPPVTNTCCGQCRRFMHVTCPACASTRHLFRCEHKSYNSIYKTNMIFLKPVKCFFYVIFSPIDIVNHLVVRSILVRVIVMTDLMTVYGVNFKYK